MIHNSLSLVFFGTDEFSVIVLDELKKQGFIPSLIVTTPDRRKGRGMILTPPPVKRWYENQEAGIKNQIELLQPEKLDNNFVSTLNAKRYTLFVVASYGKILPKEILDIPKHGALNVHPSLLPLYRGPSPIHSQILENTGIVGVTIMLMDEKIDHGPIVAQQVLGFSAEGGSALGRKISDLRFKDLRDTLAHLGGKLLAETISEWVAGNIDPQEQDHAAATYTKPIKKKDGLIDLSGNPELNYRKFLAYGDWPSVYFFRDEKRVKITDVEFKNGEFVIKKVIPEGKSELGYQDFIKNRSKQF